MVFHVIISGHFKVDPASDAVFIRCEPKLLGGFNPDTDKHRLKYLRYPNIYYSTKNDFNSVTVK